MMGVVEERRYLLWVSQFWGAPYPYLINRDPA